MDRFQGFGHAHDGNGFYEGFAEAAHQCLEGKINASAYLQLLRWASFWENGPIEKRKGNGISGVYEKDLPAATLRSGISVERLGRCTGWARDRIGRRR